uniref:Aminopeptidase n=1 Tax=Clytia hemisphaerica TaxID=252671 RepID=A0A7M6DKS9_9CNID|eukprot:TCONS_00029056-protein
MKFWNEAWLKEGFATFIAYIVIEDINPSMELMNTVLSDLMLKAMDIDSFSTSKPISRTVNTPNEIRQIFDSITYYKGCCMVQTLYCYMGKANFQRGMQRYLKTYSYGNANQDDLWNELSKESGGKDIKSVMDTWTKQIGHPVITTKRINATHMQVKQDRFKLDPPGIEAPKSPFNYRWKVPIIVKNINSKQQKTHLLSTEEDIFPITNDDLLNPDHSLYYRVNYGEETFARLVKELNNDHLKLTELDRAGLVSDYFYLFKAKLKTLNETLKTLDYIENEQASTVWDIAAGEMGQLSALIQSKDHKDKWRKFVFTKVNKTVSSIGWETKSTYKESALQTTMLRFGCHMNISSVVQTAKLKFSEWMNGTLVLDKNLYPVMRECAISNSLNDDTFFAYTYQRYLETRDNALLTSLTTVKNPKLIQSFLQDALNKSIVKDNDASYTIGKIAKYSQQGKDMAWNLVKERWSEIFQRYGDNIFLLARLLTAVLEDFSTEQKLKDIQAFFKEKKNLGSGKNAIDQAILKIKFRIVYRDIINNDPWFR